MAHRYAQIAFTGDVRQVQSEQGSREAYASFDHGADRHGRLGAPEADFIRARDSFYMASVNAAGWPYVQHRGGPPGFVRVLDAGTLGFADYSGNGQYISVGNLRRDNRVALFFMDYAHRTRLKLFGRLEWVPETDTETLARLEVDDYRARVERAARIHVEAFDWNCPQHITPRFTQAEMDARLAPLAARLAELEAGPSAGTWGDGPLPLVVSGIRQLTPDIRAFELAAADARPLPPVAAGAHLGVPAGPHGWRAYSLTNPPGPAQRYHIAVRHDPDGQGGSAFMHTRLGLGSVLNCQPPTSHFALHADARPALLIAGGIGITALMGMAAALAARRAPFRLHYIGRSRPQMAFVDRLARDLGAALMLHETAHHGRPDLAALLRAAPAGALIYVCGPEPLLAAVRAHARVLGLEARLRFERFGPPPAADQAPLTVHLARSGRSVAVAAGQSVLAALHAAGVDHPWQCGLGHCRRCVARVLEGTPAHRDQVLTAAERDQFMCPCVSRAEGDHLTLDL
jgi:ferredoxin-NADP reductase/predicted pyridoxine 5'-phosphate oxidase superfamily flavin-nucleotide-binding protein